MGHIIEFADWLEREAQYQEMLTEAQVLLVEAHHRILTVAMNLAVADVWREWNALVPEGAEIQIGFDSLQSCGDPHVERLAAIGELIRNSGFIEEVEQCP